MNWVSTLLMFFGFLFARTLFRDWRNPGVLFAAAWFIGCLFTALVGDLTYGISFEAALIYFGIVLLFNVGVLFVTGMRSFGQPFNKPDWLRSHDLSVIISSATVFILLLAPIFIWETLGNIRSDEIGINLADMRAEQVDLSGSTGKFSFLNNLPILVQATAMLAAYNLEKRWTSQLRFFVLVSCWLILGISTGSKSVTVQAPVILLFCVIMSSNRIDWSGLIVTLIISIGLFSVAIFLINFGYQIFNGGAINLDEMAATVVSYFLGGLVGFSAFLDQGLSPFWAQNPLRSVLYTVNAVSTAIGFGDIFYIGSPHAPFVSLGPNIEGNVYTAIFSYYAAGEWLGVLLWPVLAGMLCGWVYRSFFLSRSWALVAVPILWYGVVASVNSEQIFGAFLGFLKLWLVIGAIRKLVILRGGR